MVLSLVLLAPAFLEDIFHLWYFQTLHYLKDHQIAVDEREEVLGFVLEVAVEAVDKSEAHVAGF